MKVKELIKYLKTIDKDIPVVVTGYEGGYDDVFEENLHIINVIKLDNPSWWCGHYQETSKTIHNKNIFKVVALGEGER